MFFAEEQKFWYEELGFRLDVDCVKCTVCRKKQRGLERSRERYQELFQVSERTVEQSLEMVACCLSLVEGAVFHHRQLQNARMMLKKIAAEVNENVQEKYGMLLSRLQLLELEDWHGP